MASLDLNLCLNSEKLKRFFSPSIITSICTLVLAYNLTRKPRTSNQITKTQNSGVRISKHIKLHKWKPKIWPGSSVLDFRCFVSYLLQTED